MIRAGIVVLIAIALPFLLGQFWAYQLGLYALYAAAAVGVGLCWGQGGFLPLGQALFFGLAAYLSGLAFIAFQDSPIVSVLTLPLAAIVSGVLAYLIGIVIFRRSGESGAYFSMITLALALLAFQIATSWNSVTGGFNGLKGIPGLPGLDDISDVYYVAASVLLALLAFGAWLYNAPIGVLWRALAQNERRLKLFGFDTDQLKAVAFGVSGLMAGIGGAIYAPQQGIVTPQVIGFGLSADLVIWAAVGGRASLLGPVIGTLVVGSLTAQLRDTLPFWEVLMALFFIAIVLVFPRGIAGLADPLLRYFPVRKRERAVLAAPGDAAARPPAKLALDGVSVHVGEVTILDKLSVDFDQAGIFCVIGPNGAGKTSMFNVVSGELSTASGAIDLGGLKIAGLAPNRVSGLGVARKLQIPSVFPELSIADNLAVALWSGRAGKLALLDPRLRRWTSPMLKELQSRYPFLAASARKAAELSHGEQQILELAMALLTEPRVLLLDEPCAGLSPEETSAVMEIIRWAALRLGGSIIIIEHDMSLVKELAQIVYVLHNGALLAKGNVAAIQADPAVRAVYVGGEK
jgi:branched-chain amino acid transport system permease protein